ncbi:MAG: peptide-methionine (R)-S-oxide reductase MsrB [Verrucomicrobiota bacterium]
MTPRKSPRSNPSSLYFAGSALSLLLSGLQPTHAEPPKAQAPQSSQSQSSPASTTVNKEELRTKLTPEQFAVTCNAATEPPFKNAYWNNHASGIYVDVIDGEPLFASNHKFDSGSGWPSFFQPLNKGSITEKEDRSHNMVRVEVTSTKSGAHLGHLFPDGPRPTGMRYCINSASLRFIPVEELEKAGYGKFKPLFETQTEAPTPEKK